MLPAPIAILVRSTAFLLLASNPVFAGGCRLGKIVEFPITMVDLRPMVTANINDVDVRFLVDSGAFYSMISTASAAELKLKTSPAPFGFYLMGVHGTADVSVARAKAFTLAGVPMHDVEFLVGGSEVGQGSIGLLGQNFLHFADVEYDLGQGVVRLMKAEDCRKAFLAYWVGKSMPYSVIDLVPAPALSSGTTGKTIRLSPALGSASVNGTEIRVLFDTGAAQSILSLKAAARAGIKPESPGVVSAGASHGIGRSTFASYVAPFSSFKVGDEEIKNTRLRIGDIDLPNADMLIGADFFLSHRIYVANSQNKLYFTYQGGPVFNLAGGARSVPEPAAEASEQQPNQAAAAIEDAADYGRRGAAYAARREFDQALAAVTRACELAPGNPEYIYERGMVHWHMRQPDAAMADFDQALKLKPDDLPALMARAALLLQRGDADLAVADLSVGDRHRTTHPVDRLSRGRCATTGGIECALLVQGARGFGSGACGQGLQCRAHARGQIDRRLQCVAEDQRAERLVAVWTGRRQTAPAKDVGCGGGHCPGDGCLAPGRGGIQATRNRALTPG
jgi:predicted aspartyl protease